MILRVHLRCGDIKRLRWITSSPNKMLSLIPESLYANIPMIVAITLVSVLLGHLIPYLIDSHGLRSYPGPLIAKFSNIWLGCVSYKGHRSEDNHDLHMKYASNHISVARADTQPLIYGHGNGTLRSSFCDAFVSITQGLFRDRVNHSRKRKIISHVFLQKSVLELEPHVNRYIGRLLGQWDKLYDNAMECMSGAKMKGGLVMMGGFGWTVYHG